MIHLDESGKHHVFLSTSKVYSIKTFDQHGEEIRSANVMRGSASQMGGGAYQTGSGGELIVKRDTFTAVGEERYEGGIENARQESLCLYLHYLSQSSFRES